MHQLPYPTRIFCLYLILLFPYRHGEKQNYRVASTPPGEALAAEIIRALC